MSYDRFNDKNTKKPNNIITKWDQDLETDDTELQWTAICTNQKIIKSIVLRSFHYKFIHRILPCNELLCKYKIINSPACDFCNSDIETFLHLFWDCPIISNLWKNVIEWLSTKYQKDIEMDKDTFVLSKFYGQDGYLFLISVIVKQYIFSCKYAKVMPSIEVCKEKILNVQKMELYIAKKNNTIKKFENFWKI